MVEIAVIADTHIPSRAARLPGWVAEAVADADVVVHAGDFDSAEAYDRIESLADRLVAVAGNADPDLGLPEVRTLEVGGVALVVTHGSGPLAGHRERVLEIVRRHDPAAVGITGHTHELADETVDGTRLLNPGTATGAAPAEGATMFRCHAEAGELEVVPLSGG